jgi:hypothetical protein
MAIHESIFIARDASAECSEMSIEMMRSQCAAVAHRVLRGYRIMFRRRCRYERFRPARGKQGATVIDRIVAMRQHAG